MDDCAAEYRRFLEGDESAVAEIMEALFLGLVFFIDRYVGDVHAAEDIALDVMSDLFVYKRRYNFKVSLKTYLYMLGKSRALDYLRRRKRIEFTELSEAENAAEEAELEEAVLADERKRALNAALGRLPEDMQAAIHLVYFDGLTYEEAAKVMKKSKKQIDNLIYRAKKELRSVLGEEDQPPL